MYLGLFCCSACFYAWELCCPTHNTGPMVGTLEARGSWTLTPHQRSGLVFGHVFLAFVDSCLSYEAFPAGEQRRVSRLFTCFSHISNRLDCFSDFRGDQAVRGRGMQLLETPEERRSEKYSCK